MEIRIVLGGEKGVEFQFLLIY